MKFIHRKICHTYGLTDEQIGKEVYLHKECSGHPNVIKLLDANADHSWLYIAMELATGGDLFDKIEPDIGVDEQISHFYFKQLISSIDFLHKKGVAHRDIKPENILLDSRGNLKLADFGLATVFKRGNNKQKRLCRTPCGSPPYMAPEIVLLSKGYDPECTDIWACGVVLFVLLTGETPWEEPSKSDPFFGHYLANDGKILNAPWNKFEPMVLSLLRMILKIDVDKRATMDQIRKHVWVNKDNLYSTPDGLCKDSLLLTAKLLENMHIGLSDESYVESSNESDRYNFSEDHFIASQPVADIAAMIDDEEDNIDNLPATQQIYTEHNKAQLARKLDSERESIFKIISKDPAILQFSQNKQQKVQIIPQFNYADRLTRFFSVLPIESLLPIILSALHRIGVPTSGFEHRNVSESYLNSQSIHISVQTVDRRKMYLRGSIKIARVENLKLKTVEFVKTKGDPLEWRRFFKRITVLSREAVYIEEN